MALQFVFKHPAKAHDGEDRWYKADGDFHRPPSDFHIRMPRSSTGPFWSVWERKAVEAKAEIVEV